MRKRFVWHPTSVTDGRLVSWTFERAVASGLPNVAQGELVQIDGGGFALVTALLNDRVELSPLSLCASSIGVAVRATGPLVVPAGDDLNGRTVDCLGNPLDSGPALARDHVEPIFGRDPVVIPAAPAKRLTLGALVVDLQRVIPMGASLLAVGRSEVLRHVLQHQVAMGRVVVLATPGTAGRAQLALLRGDQPADPRLPRVEPLHCIHVAAETGATPAQQWLVPWSALAIAARLRARGRDVVVVIDDIDAWRPHALRFPDRGTWATQLAQLASRAYATPAGSVSLLAMTAHASTLRVAAFDELLDLELVLRGEIPATGSKIVCPPIRVHTMRRLGAAVVAAARLAEIEDIANIYPQVDHTTQLALEEGRRYRECLRFRVGATIDSLEQELCLIAVGEQRGLPVPRVTDFIDAYLACLRRDHADTLAAIRKAAKVSADHESVLLETAAKVAAGFLNAGQARSRH